jgi:hypothetical protein
MICNYTNVQCGRMSQDSSVDIGTGYGLGDQMIGFDSWRELGIFLFRHRVKNGSGVHPASYTVGMASGFPS